MRWLLPLFLVLGCAGGSGEEVKSTAGPYLGLSAYAIFSDNFQGEICDKFIDIERASDRPGTSALWGSFGHNYQCAYRFFDDQLSAGKQVAFEIHFSNETCRKFHRCNNQDFFPNDSEEQINHRLEVMNEDTINTIYWRLTDIRSFTAPYENKVYLVLSIQLEGELSEKAQQNMLKIIGEVWPYPLAVYGPAPDGVYSELHNIDSPAGGVRCIQNNDGRSFSLIPGGGITLFGQPPATLQQAMDYLKGSIDSGCLSFLWLPSLQGVDGKTFVPTLERKFWILEEEATQAKLLLDHIAQ